jgi:multidrug efflux pump subunit AcrB
MDTGDKKTAHSFSLLVVFLVLGLLGLLSIPLLNIQLSPSTTLPSVSVSYSWNNASPELVEKEITSRLEGAFSTVGGIHKITSTSNRGYGSIDLLVDKYSDPDQIRFELSIILRQIFPQLPEGVSFPRIIMNRPDDESDTPLLTYSLTGNANSAILEEYAINKIKKEIASVEDVKMINVYGGTPFSIEVIYDHRAMEGLGLQEADVMTALRQYFDRQHLGIANTSIDIAPYQRLISVKINNSTDSIIDWNKIQVKRVEDRIICLSDIASIRYAQNQPSAYFRINSMNAIYLVVYPENGANHIKTAQKVKEQMLSLSAHLPKGYFLKLNDDSTIYIREELAKIYWRTLFTIVILLIFVAVLGRNIKYILAIILSLAVNIATCFLLYVLLGIEIHLYSLAGITISLGLIIDNTIIMIDHIRHKGNLRVFMAILASTLTTVASLSIIFLLPEGLRLNLKDFALIIMINLMVSLMVALFFIPALISRMHFTKRNFAFRRGKARLILLFNIIYEKFIQLLLRFRLLAIIIAILAFGLPSFLLPTKMGEEKRISGLYNKTLGSDWYTKNAMPIVNKALGGALRLFSHYVYERSTYSAPEKTMLYMYGSMSNECTISQMNEVILDIENFLSQFGEIDIYVSRIYGSGSASISISFKEDYEKTSFPYMLKGRLIGKSIDRGGISWHVYGVGQGFSQSAFVYESSNFSISMYGYNLDELIHQAEILKEKLKKHPRVRDIVTKGSGRYWLEKSLYEYLIIPDRYSLSHADLSVHDIYSQLSENDLNHPPVLSIINNHKPEQVKLYSDKSKDYGLWNLVNEPAPALNNKAAGIFSDIEKQRAPSAILKENQQYIKLIRFNYLGSYKFGHKFTSTVLEEMKEELPLGYHAEIPGYSWGKEDTLQYGLLLLIILLIYMICSILFESLLQPLAIIFIIPLSFIGVFMTFYWFDFNFDQGGYASFVLLSGLTVNASIYIINEYNIIRKDNAAGSYSPTRLYIKAFNAKIIPILLTILSTILGLIPFLVLGKNEPFWFALAAGSTGGLIFSVFMFIIYLPILVIPRKSIG